MQGDPHRIDEPPSAQVPLPGRRTRSRFGCVRCRRRRQRCDQRKAGCQRCADAGSPCQYEVNLKWGGRRFAKSPFGIYLDQVTRDSATDGEGFVYSLRDTATRLPKREAASNQTSRIPSNRSSNKTIITLGASEENATPGPPPDADIHNQESSNGSTGLVHHSSPAINTTVPLFRLDFGSSLSPMARFLFHHYVSEAIRLTAPSDYARSEICRFIVPMSHQWPCLYFAVATFAVVHLDAIGGIPGDAERLLATMQAQSIRDLRQHLDEQNPQGQIAVLATTRTLCQAHIFRGESVWRTYLEGARAVIQSTGGPNYASEPSVGSLPQTFLSSWYNNAEALAALTPLGLPKGQLESKYLKSPVSFFDPFGGVASDLPDFLREVGALMKERSRRDVVDGQIHGPILSNEDINREGDILAREAQARLERDSAQRLLSDRQLLLVLSQDEIEDYALSNAGFLYTALLHIYCGVKGLQPSAARVQYLVEQIIRCAHNMKPSTGSSPRVLLVTPLFTAGLCAIGLARERVKSAFADISKWMKTPHILQAMALLDEYWSKLEPIPREDMWSYLGK